MISIRFDKNKLPGAGLSVRMRNAIALGASSGINKTTASVKVAMARAMAAEATVRVGDVKDALQVSKATPTRLQATLRAANWPIPLIAYRATRGGKGLVTATVFGQHATFPHAFIATVRGPLPHGVVSPGHRGVFVRRGKARLPIRQMYGPPLARIFEHHITLGQRRRDELLTQTVNHEIAYQLAKVK